MRLLLVRHGEAEWNTERRFMGQQDSPLTVRGTAQAAAVADRLSEEGIDAIVSSDLGRARSTAARIGTSCGLELRLDPRLRERHAGVLQGLQVEEAQRRYPEVFAGFRCLGASFRAPGGESAIDVESRLQSFLDEMQAYPPEATVVAVTHGAILMAFLRMTLRIPHDTEGRVAFGNACICELQSRQGAWELHRWNDTCHLRRLERAADSVPGNGGEEVRTADGMKR